MKLYCFREWNKKNHDIELTEWETDEVLFKEELNLGDDYFVQRSDRENG